VILKVLLVNMLAALNFANVFLNKKRLENKKNVEKRKKRDQNKKNVKNVFTSMNKIVQPSVDGKMRISQKQNLAQ